MLNTRSDRTVCIGYELRLENYLDGVEDPAATTELAAHLESCTRCREALEAARLGRELLREGLAPAKDPGATFTTRVMAGIRADEGRRQQFWQPLQVLAWRLALTTAAALLVLTVYLYELGPASDRVQVSWQSQVSEGLPEPATQPASQDEVLLSLAGDSNGY